MRHRALIKSYMGGIKEWKECPCTENIRRSQLTKSEQKVKAQRSGKDKMRGQLDDKTKELEEHLSFKYSSKLERKYCN